MNEPDPLSSLSAVDRRILDALLQQHGRVASRDTLMRLASVESLTNRRIDVSIVVLRRVLGADGIVTVRQRGWMLTASGIEAAQKLLASQVDRQP
jgi:DNA-binding winged helix-turn-helix (wHTH) protein